MRTELGKRKPERFSQQLHRPYLFRRDKYIRKRDRKSPDRMIIVNMFNITGTINKCRCSAPIKPCVDPFSAYKKKRHICKNSKTRNARKA